MNKTLEAFARKTLKELLPLLPEDNQIGFKMMYSHKDRKLPINEVVDKMHIDLLDHAMVQVENTLKNNGWYI